MAAAGAGTRKTVTTPSSLILTRSVTFGAYFILGLTNVGGAHFLWIRKWEPKPDKNVGSPINVGPIQFRTYWVLEFCILYRP